MSATLSLRHVSKSFLGTKVVSEVTCSFFAGEIVGIMGKNGAGKSTLIRMLAGVISPDDGEICIAGEGVILSSTKAARLNGLAFVHQELNDIPTLSIAENIFLGEGYPTRFGLVDRQELLEKAKRALALVGSTLDPGREVASLSIAQRRLVMIAAAMARNARILILDEPTASLTDSEITSLHALLIKLRAAGLTVLYVSHRLQEVLTLTDRIIVMRDGQLTGIFPTSDLDEASLVQAITGDRVKRTEDVALTPLCIAERGKSRLSVRNIRLGPTAKPIAIEVSAGEILGVAGLVGSGRTELLRAFAGADFHQGAQLSIDNLPIMLRSPREALAHGIALVPEDRREMGVLHTFTVTENITIGTLKRHRVAAHAPFPMQASEKKTTLEFIERLKIKTSSESSRMDTLSGGNQQKAILARCLAVKVRWLLLDEPTHGIDVDAKREILSLVRNLAAAGVGIVYVCSDFQELLQSSTRIIVLREGELAATFDSGLVSESDLLACCYG